MATRRHPAHLSVVGGDDSQSPQADEQFKPLPSSIDQVNPVDIDAGLQSDMLRELMAMIRADEEISPERISGVVDLLVGSLPEVIRNEIEDLEGMKAELTQILVGFVSVFSKKEEVENAHVENLISHMMTVFVKHHAYSRVQDTNMSPHQVDDRYDPYVSSDHQWALVGKKVSALAIWVASAYTSWMGVSHYGGMVLGEFEKMFGLSIPGQLEYVIRSAMGIVGAVAVSHTVLRIKKKIEEIANKNNMNLLRATGEGISMMARDRRFIALAALAFVLLLDGGTNTSGIFTLAGARKDANAQVAGASAQIMDRVGAIRGEIDGFRTEIPGQVEERANHIIAEELDGESETAAAGDGPMYHTKVALYMEDTASLEELQGSALRDDLGAVLRESGLIDGKSLKKETKDTVEDSLSTVETLLDQVEADVQALDSSKALELIQDDIDRIVEKLAQAIAILNEDLQDDLTDHLDRYTELNNRIARIALQSGEYPGFEAAQLTGFDFPEVAIENSAVDIEPSMQYRGTTELWKAAVEGSKPAASVILLMIALLGGLALSQGDQTLIHWTRKSYAKDAERENTIKQEYFNKLVNRIAFVLARVLNQGPWSEYFKNCKVHPGYIVEVIEGRIQEIADRSNGNSSKLKRKATEWMNSNSTDVAIEHNARVKALQQIMADPSEIFELVNTLMPGMRQMRGKGLGHRTAFSGGDKRSTATQMNNQHLDIENTRVQQQDLLRVQHSIRQITTNGANYGQMEQAVATLNVGIQAEIENIEADITTSNQPLLAKVKEAKAKKLLEVYTHMAGLVEAGANQLDIKPGCSEDKLRAFDGRIERLKAHADFVRAYADHTADFNNAHMEAADRAIQDAVQAVADARTANSKAEEDADRARVAQEKKESNRRVIQDLDAWFTLRSRNEGALANNVRADLLLGVLGEPNCIGRYGEVPEDQEQGVLDEYERITGVLRAELENPALRDETVRRKYVDIDIALEEDRTVMLTFFASRRGSTTR